MLIRRFKDCQAFIAGDGSILREFLHPDKQPVSLRYSLAHAVLPVGKTSLRHSLKTSEVYYILEGEGVMHVDGQEAEVKSGDCIYIPPNTIQYLKNTGAVELKFICIVDPAWRKESEVIF
jgi:mannose-6-phosphate isomerase-like protein (cupin superfamily)